MWAEIERELACFEAAIRVLTYDFPEELRAASDLILDLARQQKSVVARIPT